MDICKWLAGHAAEKIKLHSCDLIDSEPSQQPLYSQIFTHTGQKCEWENHKTGSILCEVHSKVKTFTWHS